jgi:predicted Zn-dependent peptidase
MDFTHAQPVTPPTPVRGLNPVEPPLILAPGPLGSVRFAPIRGARRVVIAVSIPAGSRDEKKGEEGAAHFLEHVLFKRTERFGSAAALWQAIETLGGEANASTERELTTYYIDVPRPGMIEAAGILGEILFGSTYTSEDIEAERGVVIEEIRASHDDAETQAEMALEALLFGPAHHYGRDIAGTVEQIRLLPEKTIRSFYKRHYVPAHMSFVVAGDLNPGEVSRARVAFTSRLGTASDSPSIEAGRKGMRPPRLLAKHPATPGKSVGARIGTISSGVEQVRIAVGAPSFGRHHPSEPALDVFDAVLGGGSASRLFLRLREEKGLAYSVSTSTFAYADAGAFTISAGVDPARTVEATGAIMAELREIASTPVSDDELERAKGYLVGTLERFVADVEAVADWRAGELHLDRETRRIEEEIARIRAVDADDLLAVAKKLLRPSELRISYVAPASAIRAIATAEKKGKLGL